MSVGRYARRIGVPRSGRDRFLFEPTPAVAGVTETIRSLSEPFLRSDVDSSCSVCLYAFMRTTVELPPELMRAAKARSAELGESLKSLFARAVAAELGAESDRPQARG